MNGVNGLENLKQAVMKDCEKGNGCFNPNGCDHEFTRIVPSEGKMKEYSDTVCKHVSKCTHKYCDKFKWVIDRAKHYADKLGLNWEDLLNSWENNRGYWYMNYYQECNQPEIKGEAIKVFDTVEDLIISFEDKGFRCPHCGGISKDAYTCDSGKVMSNGKPCDWKVYGLFGDMGKGVYIFIKEKLRGQTIFMPVAWEQKEAESI